MSSEMNPLLLTAALEGFELQLERLEAQIAQVRAITSGRKSAPAVGEVNTPANGERKVRVVSEEARKRMADAQKKRWAKYHAGE